MGHSKQRAVTILLVEDEALIRIATAAMLEDAGYCVLEGPNGDAALETLDNHPEIDVVITDVQMPGKVDGLALVQIIGHDYPRIQTVITSGRTCMEEARDCGAHKFLSKPYTAEAMQLAVRSVLRNQ